MLLASALKTAQVGQRFRVRRPNLRGTGLDDPAYTADQRASELVGVRLEDLGRSGLDTVLGRARGKTRITPVWKDYSWANRHRLAVRPETKERRLFLNARGRQMSPHGFAHCLVPYAKAATAKEPPPADKRIHRHAFRNRCACRLLRSGFDISAIRAWLSRASHATANIFAEVDLRAKMEAMKSTCPGDAGDEPIWKSKADLLEQLKAI